MVETLRLLKDHGESPEDIRFSPEHLSKLILLAEDGAINNSVAKKCSERCSKRI